jgi:hypothetical protein
MKEVFKKGHFYKFKDGRALYVIDVCHCERCESRGLYEPYIMWLDDCSTGWSKDYINEYGYDDLANDIAIESDSKEEWVEKYINKTVNDNKNSLLREIDEYIGKEN